jgi:threonine/homoserine/homoserine lactone efflux protein
VDWHVVASFMIATLITLLTPGPVMAIVAHNTVRNGASGGLLTAIGIGFGELCLLAATSIGLLISGELLPALFRWLSLAGALYLIVLALGALRARSSPARRRVEVRPRKAILDGLTVAFGNPAALIFYAAFFPQFIDPERPIAEQMLVLGAIYLFTTLAFDLACVLALARIRFSVDHPRFGGLAQLGSVVVYLSIAAIAVAGFLNAPG